MLTVPWSESGGFWFQARRQEERAHPIEQVGERLRALMPFLDPLTVTPEGELRPAAARVEAVP